ncbi:MAG: rhomboid family intramembrane serine protease [Phycisphaerales bacterium JB043]
MGLQDRHYARTQPGHGAGGIGFGRVSGPGSPRHWSANTWIIVLCIAVFAIDALVSQGGKVYELVETVRVSPGGTPREVVENALVADTEPTSTGLGQATRPLVDAQSGQVVGHQHYMIMRPLEAWFHFSTIRGLEIWRLVGFQFLHGGMNHLLFNMLGLFFFGGLVERYLGKKRYVAYYLLTGVCGALLYLMLNLMGYWNVPLPGVLAYDIWTPLIGASAGVFGVLMAAAYLAPNATVLFLFIIPMKMSTLIYLLVGIAAFTLITQGSNAGGEAAHLGGAIAGFWFIRKPARIWRVVEAIFGKGRPAAASKKPKKDRKSRAKRGQPSEQEVDRILAKVANEGLHSLTDKERSVLRRATEDKRA